MAVVTGTRREGPMVPTSTIDSINKSNSEARRTIQLLERGLQVATVVTGGATAYQIGIKGWKGNSHYVAAPLLTALSSLWAHRCRQEINRTTKTIAEIIPKNDPTETNPDDSFSYHGELGTNAEEDKTQALRKALDSSVLENERLQRLLRSKGINPREERVPIQKVAGQFVDHSKELTDPDIPAILNTPSETFESTLLSDLKNAQNEIERLRAIVAEFQNVPRQPSTDETQPGLTIKEAVSLVRADQVSEMEEKLDRSERKVTELTKSLQLTESKQSALLADLEQARNTIEELQTRVNELSTQKSPEGLPAQPDVGVRAEEKISKELENALQTIKELRTEINALTAQQDLWKSTQQENTELHHTVQMLTEQLNMGALPAKTGTEIDGGVPATETARKATQGPNRGRNWGRRGKGGCGSTDNNDRSLT